MTMSLTLLLFLCILGVPLLVVSHTCVHDQLLKENPPQEIRTDVKYAPRVVVRDGKRVVNDEAYEGLRIHLYNNQLDNDLSSQPELLNYLKDEIFPEAIGRLNEVLQVIPVQGNLTLSRRCTSFYPNEEEEKRECTGYDPVSCGTFGEIPEEHYASQPVYSAPGTISSHTDGGPGVPDTDIIIYTTAQSEGSCSSSSSTLAYAAFCVMDTEDRPVGGYVNFCPGSLDSSSESRTKTVMTTIHEISHALGYSSSLYKYFRYPNGTARTKRRVSNSGEYTLDHGSPPSEASSETTIQEFSERGSTVKKLILDEALEKAREHFDCDSLNGVELENQGGSGTASSHPEMRIYFNDYMNGQYPATPVISPTTLAVFESSGWYKPNYDAADFHTWGYKAGCNFATEKCLSNEGGTVTPVTDGYFCTTAPNEQDIRCTQDLSGFGLCSTVTYSSNLESKYQYFAQGNVGGQTALTDYCPFYDTFNWNEEGVYPAGRSLCTNEDGTPSQNSRGETYGVNSKCAVNTLLSRDFQGSENSVSGGCFTFDCRSDSVRILVGDSYVTCEASEAGQKKSVSGYKGSFICPDHIIACGGEQQSSDCSVDCGAHGTCVGEVCVCTDGWDGERCNTQRNASSMLSVSIGVMMLIAMVQLLIG